jgi:hypothetical protein
VMIEDVESEDFQVTGGQFTLQRRSTLFLRQG